MSASAWALLAIMSLCALVMVLCALTYLRDHDRRSNPREVKLVPWNEAEEMLRSCQGWRLALEKDTNQRRGWVYLERKVQRRAHA